MNKKLAEEILERVRIDQTMRKRFVAGKVNWDKRIDERNTDWLKKVIARHGWPTISMVGKRASHDAWLLAQHADHDLKFQKKGARRNYDHHRKRLQRVGAAGDVCG